VAVRGVMRSTERMGKDAALIVSRALLSGCSGGGDEGHDSCLTIAFQPWTLRFSLYRTVTLHAPRCWYCFMSNRGAMEMGGG
jgi:hypothetical protein